MDTLEWFRGAERLIIVCGGISAIVLGALLLKWGVFVPSNFVISGGGANAKAKFKVSLDNATPGALFALFGAAILSVSLFSPAQREETTTKTKDGAKSEQKGWKYSDPQKLTEFLEKVANIEEVNKSDLDYLKTTAKDLRSQYEEKK